MDKFTVCIYADTTGLFAQEFVQNITNLIDVGVPLEWFKEKVVEHGMDMDYVFKESIADDFEWLWPEAKQDGIDLEINAYGLYRGDYESRMYSSAG